MLAGSTQPGTNNSRGVGVHITTDDFIQKHKISYMTSKGRGGGYQQQSGAKISYTIHYILSYEIVYYLDS